jgi:acyl dehydratase
MNEYRWENIKIGLRHEFQAVFNDENVQVFTQISSEINPLHVDREYALSAGFPGPVLFGMLTSSFYSTLVGVYMPGKYALLQGMPRLQRALPRWRATHRRWRGCLPQ